MFFVLFKNMQTHIQKGPWKVEKHVWGRLGGFLELSEGRLEPRLGSTTDADYIFDDFECLWGFILEVPGFFFAVLHCCCASGLG